MTPHEIARTRLTSHSWELHLRLDPALFWFKGHFAAQPLLPGVTQLDWVMYYARELLVPGANFRKIINVKFQAPLLPENEVCLTLTWQPERNTLSFSYHRLCGEQRLPASSGKIRLCL
ncbi:MULTISPECIES: ApeI family dehydratase [Atlantibacter]|uniref:ApeI dehydratase-like domain-containing protein n=1 Tax=Atlantibacter hermannii NBRC 105704 TaxID=1115512 RepID=H5V3L5_ATLHE|nr:MULTISPECIES: hydroxymyristoyl-ACP dehydratase [Atlantibacter]QPS91611.1 hydroxymyristoyl-ACP dehydratase [Atlantibacter hermannii]GAB52573.1 hypothetical protein EH105704_07_01400 [Atlantibacter hermannii NBRC 105704]VDZ71239.1 putative fatty acid degradation enzyme [Atlantibacter hermannii]HCC12948.1 hydroxymyristoyl-ACP dehydratase [Atlantibacter hermannii]